MNETETLVWRGAEALRADLVPVAELRTHPQNPRRGAVEEIARSLERFGQLRPILTLDRVIVAGNHTYLAAVKLGWTHVAAVPNEFASEDEARAYLLTDNRLPEMGGYDTGELVALLDELAESRSWQGTGYSANDHARLHSQLEALAQAPPEPPPPPAPDARVPPGAMLETVLLYDEAAYAELGRFLQVLQKEWGDADVPDLIFRAVEAEARRLNQGEAA